MKNIPSRVMPIAQMQFFLLMVSVFTVFIGYGIALPILPFLLENRFGGSAGFSVAFHTGMLTGVFMFMLFICAPIWGRLSDSIGRRPVIIIGLGGSILALLLFGFAQQLWFAYLMRALGGALASAVLPVSLAYITDSCFKERRARRFAWMSASATFGILIGPVAGGWLSGLVFWGNLTGFDANSLPFLITGLFGLVVWILLVAKLDEPRKNKPNSSSIIEKHTIKHNNPSNILLILALLGMFALGSFEVGIALQGQQILLLSPFQIGVLYMVCSVMMIIVQVFLFSALISRFTFTQIISGALLLMALGLIIFPVVSRFEIVLLAVALIGLSSGVLVPILAFQASLSSEMSQGKILGKQTAAGSLGQALGSVFAGVLFSIFTQAPFWFAASLLISGIFLGMRLRRIQPESK